MKTFLTSILLIGSLACGWAATTINSVNKYAYGANLGWMDWCGETARRFELTWTEKLKMFALSPQTIRS